MSKEMSDIIYMPDFMKVLCIFEANRNLSLTELHIFYRTSYAQLHTFKKIYAEKGWITSRKDGHKQIVSITLEGEKVVQSIYQLMDTLELDRKSIYDLSIRRRFVKNAKQKEQHRIESLTENQEQYQESGVPGELSSNEEGTDTGEETIN